MMNDADMIVLFYTKLKYIMIEMGGFDAPLIFPHRLFHNEMVPSGPAGRQRIVSAGFVDLYMDNTMMTPTVTAYGESHSLGLKSQPERDSAIIAKALGMDGS